MELYFFQKNFTLMKNLIFIWFSGCILISCKPKPDAGVQSAAIMVDVIVPEHGMADPHAWVQHDTVFVICGHDQSWDAVGSFPMDRWEIWSSVNLTDWNYHRSILPTDTYIGDQPNCWA